MSSHVDDFGTKYVYPPRKWTGAEHVICAGDERHAAHERRIAALETQVHRLLNTEPESEVVLNVINDSTARKAAAATVEYERGYVAGKADAAPIEFEKGWQYGKAAAFATQALMDAAPNGWAHIPQPEWEAIKGELETLRAWKASVPRIQIGHCAARIAPIAEEQTVMDWLAGLEPPRAARPTMDADGVLVSHDAWDATERELAELRAFKASVPWNGLKRPEWTAEVVAWHNAHAPKEADGG